MARSRPAKQAAPAPIEPEEESQEIPDEEPAITLEPDPEPEAGGKKISKSAAARAAIEEGIESPAEAVDFIRSRFGIDMVPQHFSAVKSQFKKAGGAKSGGRPGRNSAPVLGGIAAPLPTQQRPGDGDLMQALEGVKELVSQYGADQVKRMVDLLG